MSILDKTLLLIVMSFVGCEKVPRMPEGMIMELSKTWHEIDLKKDGGDSFCTFVHHLEICSTQGCYRVHIDDVFKICGRPDVAYTDKSFYGYFYMLSDCSAYQMGVGCDQDGDIVRITLSDVHEIMLNTTAFDFPDDGNIEGFLAKYKLRSRIESPLVGAGAKHQSCR